MPGLDFFIVPALGVATVATALVAVVQKNLIRAVIAFAVSSAGLAALFFLLASPYAGALELTVGAGLVAVLLLVALVLAGGEEETVRT
jgi:NADH:ubiquinone oxidoreductase subunit 6 (subunit J)